MSLIYPNDSERLHDDGVYTPVYARGKTRRKKGGVKTWMILAPVGGAVLLGGAVMMLMYPSNEAAPLPESETPAVSAMAPIAAQPALLDITAPAAEVAPVVPNPAAAAPVMSAPVAQEAPPARRAQSTPARRAAEPAVAERAVEVAESAVPAGPRPYSGTATLNTTAPVASTPAPVTQPPAPAISVQPLN